MEEGPFQYLEFLRCTGLDLTLVMSLTLTLTLTSI